METIWEMWWKHFFLLSAPEKVLQSLVIMAGDAVSKVKTWKHTHSFWKKIWTTLTHSSVICFSSDFFLVNTYNRNKIIYAEIWGSASVSSLCFLKNFQQCDVLGVQSFCLRSMRKEKGTSPTLWSYHSHNVLWNQPVHWKSPVWALTHPKPA